MHRTILARESRLPHFLGGEDEHGRGITHQRVEQDVHHRAAGAAARIVRRVAIEAVLADIEIEGRKIVLREIGEQPHVAVELEILCRLAQFDIDHAEPVEHIKLQLGHVVHIDLLGVAEPVERAEQIAEGIAQLAIGIGGGAEHFLADANVVEIIGRGDPKPEDVRARFADDLERIDDIAERFGHLAALPVEREAVGEDGVIGCPAAGAAGFEQRGLEPAAMLVRAFEIQVRARALAVARLDHEGVRRA